MTNVRQEPWTALVVEDHPAVLDLLAHVISELGFVTTKCDTGRAALQAIRQRRFNLVLVDLGLPDMDGLHICDAARAAYAPHVAVLGISADKRQERRLAALELCDDFIGKPFNLDELQARIEARLRRLPKEGA